MIGVIPKESQTRVVEEFFELFKTPWEFYRPGNKYDVIIVTAADAPEVRAKLVLVYGPGEKWIDRRLSTGAQRCNAVLCHRDVAVPIYRGLLTFAASSQTVCVTNDLQAAGVRADDSVIRLGYDLFDEVEHLLSAGQPVEYAGMPTLDIHIEMLREWILAADISFLEISPAPAGYSFATCLTHDIDFIGIQRHKLDHTMWGFLFRATVGTLRRVLRGRLAVSKMLKNWVAVASLPFVYMGWAKDFWEPFEWYLEVERGLPATYFLIPFKRRAGDKVPGRHASRRAAAYDVTDLPHWIAILQARGCELGVHGIDAWHSEDSGREELARLGVVTGQSVAGIRMHWLLGDVNTPPVLERAGYVYDSTVGYNETVGYRAGTGQVFRPLAANTILELPLHIQDGALFYTQRLDLTAVDAQKRCQSLIDNAGELGGVLTILWHDRSHGPERLWGDFYVELVQTLKSSNAWFGTAAQVVGWFHKRRKVHFERMDAADGSRLCYEGEEIQPPLKVRFYRASRRSQGHDPVGVAKKDFVDIPWDGKAAGELEIQMASRLSATYSAVGD